MKDKKTTIIVSDLHLGGGKADPGDDHVYQHSQFRNFIDMLAATPEGQRGDIELFINGDFLEFAQVGPEVYQLGSTKYWCSEAESLEKLKRILDGHADIFDALKRFQVFNNCLMIGAGNHDVDFWWPKVRERFCSAAGPASFCLGQTWHQRYNGQLLIGHGHMFDPANAFKHWSYPILDGPDGVPRLEMCPGTLFMVKFVNWLEQKYPFADNIKPVTALGGILWKENRIGLTTVALMLLRFMAQYPSTALGVHTDDSKLGMRLKQMIQYDDKFAAALVKLAQQSGKKNTSIETIRKELGSQEAVFDFLYEVLLTVSPEQWLPLFDRMGQGAVLSSGGDGTTLAIAKAGMTNDKEILRQMAGREIDKRNGPLVVVLGHTHQPDELKIGRGNYFNPGSWTRYVEIEKFDDLCLEDLRQEDDFPYQLNYVRVEKSEPDLLKSEMICYEP